MVKPDRIQELAKKTVLRENNDSRLSKSSVIAVICVMMFYANRSSLGPSIAKFLKTYSVSTGMFEFILLVMGAGFGVYSMLLLYRGGGLIGAIAALICGYHLYLGFQ